MRFTALSRTSRKCERCQSVWNIQMDLKQEQEMWCERRGNTFLKELGHDV